MKIITNYNRKGGVGKTLLNGILATQLAGEKDKKILLIDADAQRNLTTFFLGESDNKTTIVDCLVNNLEAKEAIIVSPLEDYPSIDFIPNNKKMKVLAEILSTRNNREKIALKWFARNVETLKKYDYIIIDLSPSADIVNRNFLFASDSVISLLQAEDISSLQGAKDFMTDFDIDREELDIPADCKIVALLNQCKSSKNTSSRDFEEVFNNYDELKEILLDTRISTSTVLKNAGVYAMSVSDYVKEYKVNNKAETEINNLIEELERREVL